MGVRPLVAVLGASPKVERYSNRAIKMLLMKGFRVAPIHPHAKQIEGLPVYQNLDSIPDKIDTITLYVAGEHLSKLSDEILKAAPRRVIFNPGTENEQLAELLSNNKIEAKNACTLVLLSTGQF